MSKFIHIRKKINTFKKKTLSIPGDKSISIRFILLSSLTKGKCTGYNILKSEDVNSAIKSIRKLGVKINLKKTYCEVYGRGLFGYKYKNS